MKRRRAGCPETVTSGSAGGRRRSTVLATGGNSAPAHPTTGNPTSAAGPRLHADVRPPGSGGVTSHCFVPLSFRSVVPHRPTRGQDQVVVCVLSTECDNPPFGGLHHHCSVGGAEHPPYGSGVVPDQREGASTSPPNNVHCAVRKARGCEVACTCRDHEALHVAIGEMVCEGDLGIRARDERGLLDERGTVSRSAFEPYRVQHPTRVAGANVLKPLGCVVGVLPRVP